MAAISAKRLSETRARFGAEGRGYTQIWQVITDSRYDDGEVVKNAADLPKRGEIHPSDPYAVVDSVEADQELEDPRVWRATVEYVNRRATLTGPGGPGIISVLQARPEIEWDDITITKPVERATRLNPTTGDVEAEDVPVANSIGDRFDPPPEEDEGLVVLIYRRAEANPDPFFYRTFANSLNSTVFLGQPVGSVLCKPIKIGKLERDDDFDILYRAVEYRFVFAETGTGAPVDGTWYRYFLNWGYRAKTAAGKIYDIPDREPRNLKVSDGTVLDAAAAPEYVLYRTKKMMDFSLLNIDQTEYDEPQQDPEE